MNCPKCESDTYIIDCRQKNGNLFYRRHECKNCRERFTTVESVVAKKAAVIKAAKKDAAEKTALEIVALELGRAKAKHPDFPYLYSDRLSIIAEELGELAAAINDEENKDRQIEEAAHVAVTAIRFIEERLK